MIDFRQLTLSQKEAYEQILFSGPERGCEYSFANLFLWGRQQVAFVHGCVAFFSHFYGRSVYPYPIGPGDRRAVIGALLEDARQRGIPCRITNMLSADRAELEQWFPGQFHLRTDRDSFDYVYDIRELAALKGRKFQKKRNHYNRFRAAHPDFRLLPLDPCGMGPAQEMVNTWYQTRIREDPEGDYLLESLAMAKAFRCCAGLGLEGAVLMDGPEVLAVTMASRLSADTFDVHFEKAREDVEGAYAAVNCAFAQYLLEKYPDTLYLDREDDLGLEGLRKAKLSYNPHHLVEKSWAYWKGDEPDA